MKRLHLIELEDQAWFPAAIRNYGTDYLRFIATQFDIFKSVIPLLRKAIRRSENHQVVDLASGGGGGWIKLKDHLKEDFPELKITLTDMYPNLPAFEEVKDQIGDGVVYRTEPLDARNVPEDLKGLRTQLLSFHHFKPQDALLILQNAVDAGQPIAVLEATERSVKGIIPILFAPLAVLIFTPFIRPFKFGRIFWTYIIPIVPPFVLWDGIVSILRTYTPAEMRDLAGRVKGSDTYEWEIGKMQDGPGVVQYLIGWPKTSVASKGDGEK